MTKVVKGYDGDPDMVLGDKRVAIFGKESWEAIIQGRKVEDLKEVMTQIKEQETVKSQGEKFETLEF